ncbi:hypothetical protein [Nocardioides panacisoli]
MPAIVPDIEGDALLPFAAAAAAAIERIGVDGAPWAPNFSG